MGGIQIETGDLVIKLEEVRRLKVAPDEVLVVRVPPRTTHQDARRIHEVFENVGVSRVVVVPSSVELDVVKQEEA